MENYEAVDAVKKVKVAIVEDHISVVDGYRFRLGQTAQIEVVGYAAYGAEVEPMMAAHPADVLLMDVQVKTAPDNSNPYPILHIIASLLRSYPDLSVLVISMIAERALIQAVMDAGASGYILKDDTTSIEQLGSVIQSVLGGGIYLSEKAHELLLRRQPREGEQVLTSRQLEVLSLCAAYPEWSRGQVAAKLGLDYSTIRNTLSHAYIRLGVHNLNAAVAKARHLGLLTPTAPPSLH